MKSGKATLRIISLLLVFFLTTAGAAQALNISKCKGECCQNTEGKSCQRCSAQRLSAYPFIEIKPLILLCDPIEQFRALESRIPERQSCHNGTGSPCCEMAQANDKVEGLIPTSLSRADRSSETSLVCILPEIYTTDKTLNRASARCSMPARATPAPLYLKNSAFLC